MAKIKLPSYIKEGHGRMDDAVIITRGDKSFMKIYKKYDRGSSPKQVEVRNAFTTIVADWSYLEGIVSDAWDMSNDDPYVSGYNAFLGENLSRRRDGEVLMLCPGMGEEILMNFTAEPGTVAGEVICRFAEAEPGCHVTFFVRRV